MSEHESPSRRADCRVHAFWYARRIVLAAAAGELDDEGLYFDVSGLREHIADIVRMAAADAAVEGRSVRLLSYDGPLEAVAMRFCRQVEGLCLPREIPDPITPQGLREWAAAAQQNLRSQFAGWSPEILNEELDAVADQLAERQTGES